MRGLLYRLGRRGAALLLVSMIQVIIGTGLLQAPPTLAVNLLVINLLSLQTWGWIWTASGIIAAPFAFFRPGPDRFGFMALYVTPAVWGVAFALNAVLGRFPTGTYEGLRAAATYLGYSGLMITISGMVGAEEIKAATTPPSIAPGEHQIISAIIQRNEDEEADT